MIRLRYVARAIEPISHSEGVKGNETLLRTEEIIDDTGEKIAIPLGISGNSIKHNWLREPGARFMLDAMGVEKLSDAVVHLLWSGGPKMNSSSRFTLADARKIQALCPIVSALGYSAGNHMEEGKIEVSDLFLVCREREFCLPSWAREKIGVKLEDADYYRTARMMTRHDARGIASASRFLLDTEALEERLAKRASGDAVSAKEAKGDSTQMIATTQCLATGSWFWGEMILRDLSEMEGWAVGAALHYTSLGGDADGSITMRVGGKRNSGFGRVKVWFETSDSRLMPRAREWSEATAVDTLAPGLEQLKGHYATQRETILAALGGLYAAS